MKRSALIFPGIAAMLAVVLAVMAGPFAVPHADAASSLRFNAQFTSASDLTDQFDRGYSGQNPWAWGNGSGEGAITSFHGDHDMSCAAPTTDRTVAFGGDRSNLDYSQVFWQCMPGGDPAKGHLMTGVDTVGYNIAWFAPKPTFTNVAKVCWDQNLTTMSLRKWTHVMFVTPGDATKYPVGRITDDGLSQARGSGGFDLGFTEPGFRDTSGPTTGVIPSQANAGLKVVDGGAQWWQNDSFTGPGWGDIMGRGFDGYSSYPRITDKAARYTICVENVGDSQVSISMNDPSGTPRTALASGHIPAGPVRVVFGDDNYNPPKDSQYASNVTTWHWDNIQVYADSASSSGATTVTTPPPAGPSPTTPTTPAAPKGGSPFGSFDMASAGPGSVNVSGWAIDPDTSAPIPVHVYVDSAGTALTANGSRPDVEGAFPGFGSAHGFGANIAATPGAHTVCAYAINTGAGSTTVLGCRVVVVPGGSPIGSLDVVSASPGWVSAAGWALDPDTAGSIPVHVYVDGVGVAVTADGSRPDIAGVFPGYGAAHGFGAGAPAAPGSHTVCAFGIDASGSGNSLLGCRVVTVPGGSPFGSLDVVVGGSGQLSAAGWAIDPDTSAPIPVHVYVGLAGTAVTADGARADVAGAFPGYGSAHGFAATLSAAPGPTVVCAYGINVGAGANSLLGCRVVTVR